MIKENNTVYNIIFREQELLPESIALVKSYRLPGSYTTGENEAPGEVFYPYFFYMKECRIAFNTIQRLMLIPHLKSVSIVWFLQGSAICTELPSCLEHKLNGFTLNKFKGRYGNSS